MGANCRHHPCDMREERCVVHNLISGEDLILSQLWCPKCAAFLPIGPANDWPEETRVEIRAAEIATGGFSLSTGGRLRSMSWDQGAGWDAAAGAPNEPTVDEHGCECVKAEWHAGWLAFQIVLHKEPSRG